MLHKSGWITTAGGFHHLYSLVADRIRDADLTPMQHMIDQQQMIHAEFAGGDEWSSVQDQLLHPISSQCQHLTKASTAAIVAQLE